MYRCGFELAQYDILFLVKETRKGVKMRGEIWMELKADYQKGLSYSELGRKYNIDRRTAKNYAQSDSRPEYVLTESKPSKLDPYKPQINIWLEEAPYSARRILE